MPLKLVKLGEAAALGLVDVGFEKLDEKMGLGFPGNSITLGRAGLFLVGLIGDAMVRDGSKYHPYLETMYIAETPLLIRTAFKAGGVIADYQAAPSREAIELRLKSAGQYIGPRGNIPGAIAQFR